MANSSSEITVLLMLEAIDKASSILDAIGDKFGDLGDAAKDAAAKTALTGDALEAAQIKAAAAQNALAAAQAAQIDAATALSASMDALVVSQAEQITADAALAESRERLAAVFGEEADKIAASYAAMSAAAAADAESAEASAAKITSLQEKLAAVHGAAADSVQGALDREMASYAQLAEAAVASAAAVAQSLGGEDAKIVAGYQAQAAAAQAAADAVKTASAEQISALDALGSAESATAKRAKDAATAQQAADTTFDSSGAAMKGLTTAALATSAAVVGIGYESVKSASSFQSATTVLATSGGEAAGKIAQWQNGMLTYNGTLTQVRDGILSLASTTGTGVTQLTNGMYTIGSAGYTGAAGLNVLKSAAQGAKAENADLGTVSNALTTIMTDYGVSVKTAAGSTQASNAAMNQMITVVQNGKTTTEALAGSLSNVLPIAASVNLSFGQVGGAMATMTGEGVSADQASQDLNNTLNNLINPSQVAAKEMQQFGLSSATVSKQISDPSVGLTGVLAELTGVITKQMGPAGTVIMNAFQGASSAAADVKQEIAAMPGDLQTLANGFLSGSISAKQWKADIQGVSANQAPLLQQFQATATQLNSFNTQLTSGSAATTYQAALSKMTGGQTGLTTALDLTGSHMATFQSNVAQVSAAGQKAGSDVEGWSEIQGNLNQKLAEAKQTIGAAAISIGTALLPMVTKVLDVILRLVGPIAAWIEHNRTLAAVILLVVGALAIGVTVFVAAAKAVDLITGAMKTFGLMSAEVGEESTLALGPIGLIIAGIAVAALLIVTHWSTVKQWLSDFWNWLKSTAEDAWDFVKGHVNEVAGAVALLLGPLGLIIAAALEVAVHWKQVKAAVADVWDWMKSAAADVAGFVSGVWGEAVKEIDGFWQGEVRGLKVIWGALQAAWNDTGGKLVSGIAHTFDSVSAAFDKEWNKVAGDLSSIWSSLVTIWNATGGALVHLIMEGVTGLARFLAENWSSIVGFFQAVLSPIVAIAEGLWTMVEGVFSAAFELIKGIVSFGIDLVVGVLKAQLATAEFVFRSVWGAITAVVKAAWSVISGVVRAGIAVASGILEAAWLVIKGITVGAWDVITGIFNIALDLITGIFKAFAQLVTGDWSGLWNTVKTTASTVWHDISDLFTSVLGDIYSTVTGAVSKIWDGFIGGIEDAWSGVWGALKDLLNGVVNFFDGAGTWLYDVGKDIVNGLIKGVEDMASDAVKSVTNLGNDLISGAKKVLSIFSPSKEFASIGQMTVAGFVQGIGDAAPTLHAAMAKAAGGITGPALTATLAADARSTGASLVSSTAAGVGGAGFTYAGAGGTQITIDLRGSMAISDSDFDKLASKVGQKVVAALPAGGVRITKR